MTDTNTAPDEGASFTLPSYEIDPEDAELARAIVALDPVTLPGPVSVKGTPPVPEPTLDALPPHLRELAKSRINVPAGPAREAAEREAVLETLRDNALDIRSRAGFGEGVGPYHQEQASLVSQYNRLNSEVEAIQRQLDEVAYYRTEHGPDGTPKAVPVYVMGPAARRTAEQRQTQALYHASLLFNADGSLGIEGERRLAKALKDHTARDRAIQDELEIQREARKLAGERVKAERVEKLAGVYARNRRAPE